MRGSTTFCSVPEGILSRAPHTQSSEVQIISPEILDIQETFTHYLEEKKNNYCISTKHNVTIYLLKHFTKILGLSQNANSKAQPSAILFKKNM